MRLFLTSAYSDREPLATLRRYAACDSRRRHHTTDDPGSADAILFVENSHYFDDIYLGKVRGHSLTARYREKVLVYNEQDLPLGFLPGLYCSMPRTRFNSSRYRACSYILELNPFIEQAWARNPHPDLLFSFMGANRNSIRNSIFALRHKDAYVEDTTSYNMFVGPPELERKRKYAEVLSRSRFVLCPRGGGSSSYRLFETMQSGRVPVILSDDWEPPIGPAWAEFSLRVAESKATVLPTMLDALDDDVAAAMGRKARRAWEDWFAPDALFNTVAGYCTQLLEGRPWLEVIASRLPPRGFATRRAKDCVRPLLRACRKWA
jgi:hypothetical protein